MAELVRGTHEDDAVCSVQAGAAVWSRDGDFARIQTVLEDLHLYA
jgi:hypothetical protein